MYSWSKQGLVRFVSLGSWAPVVLVVVVAGLWGGAGKSLLQAKWFSDWLVAVLTNRLGRAEWDDRLPGTHGLLGFYILPLEWCNVVEAEALASSAQILPEWLHVTAQIDPQERRTHLSKWLLSLSSVRPPLRTSLLLHSGACEDRNQ